ncbi:MAG: hypothetical protein ACREMZ_05140 [Gemmatimonadales bacterium]
MAKLPASQASQLAQVFVVGILVTGCGGDGGGNGGTPPATTTIAKSSGDAQAGTVGQPLATPLSVLVTEDGAARAGATVAWSTTAPNASLDPTSAGTDANGIASTTWTLGTASGAQTATATLTGATGSPVAFTATAAADVAATLVKGGGDGQSGEINTQLALPVQAKVTDQFGNAVAGTGVDWSATDAAVSAPTVASDAAGISQVTVTLGGTAGPITIVAESDGLGGSPLTFTATAVEPTPTPSSIDVTVRNDNFLSVRNGTQNPAVDTVAVGGTVTWTWLAQATNPHDVTSSGSPSFTSSATTAQPFTYGPITFTVPGTYNYYCTQHGAPSAGMWGRIVVR